MLTAGFKHWGGGGGGGEILAMRACIQCLAQFNFGITTTVDNYQHKDIKVVQEALSM